MEFGAHQVMTPLLGLALAIAGNSSEVLVATIPLRAWVVLSALIIAQPALALILILDAGIAADNGYGGTDTLSNIYEIRGSDHDDIMTGDANNNSFIGRAGDDTIDGGDGYDRVRYDRGGVGSVNVNLDTGVVSSDGLGGTDTLTSIEHVRGSNTGNDIIVGSAANERLEGRGGNDTLTGGDGSDELYGGDGDDIINMGNGQYQR